MSLLFVACGEPGEKGDKGDKGDTGVTGVSIVSIVKDSTEGNVDTYKITMSDGTSSTFTITNGTNGTDGKDGVDGTDGVSIKGATINAKDFFVSSYTLPITLNIIRKNDIEKMKKVFSLYCIGWSEEKFKEAEDIVSGIEYAALMTTETSSPLEIRIELALTTIMRLYNVPEDIIQTKIKKVLAKDYRATGLRILQEFKEYINTKHEKH